eukprot:CAMPEP_0198230318 /NCGR_PEP_ID=MMETSP1445-20131203/114599_1 /TAXON_ID=36898 /ORGANISM="Pyramimonas sp., Strain CCMP2087" /LENGTH=191 /DNA_ID=CAMNT_0043910851 /DNA_START=465 /DNA_END=1040 /DNA_ORIENTATION=+
MEETAAQNAAQSAAQTAALQRLKQRSLVALERAGKNSHDITPPPSSSHEDGDSRNQLEDYFSETSRETSHKFERSSSVVSRVSSTETDRRSLAPSHEKNIKYEQWKRINGIVITPMTEDERRKYEEDQERLQKLSKSDRKYEEWKMKHGIEIIPLSAEELRLYEEEQALVKNKLSWFKNKKAPTAMSGTRL